MNKKDCEQIGYILSISSSQDELRQRLFELDSRIESEYKGFEEVQGRNDEVDALADKIMTEQNGHGQSLIKKEALKCSYGECLEKARRQIYGDNYNPSYFK